MRIKILYRMYILDILKGLKIRPQGGAEVFVNALYSRAILTT